MPDDDARRGILPGRRRSRCTRPSRVSRRAFSRGPTAARWAAAPPSTSSPRHQPTDEHFCPGPRRSPAVGGQQRFRARHPRSRRRGPHPAGQAADLGHRRERRATPTSPRRAAHLLAEPAQHLARGTQPLGVAGRQPPHDRHSRRLSWIPGEPFGYLTIRGMVTEMAGDFRLPRDDSLNNWQIGEHADLDARPALGRASASRGSTCSSTRTRPARSGGIVNFANLEASSPGGPSASTSPCRARSIPIRKYRQWLLAFFAAGRRPAVTAPRRQRSAALRVRHRAHRGGRQDLEPAQRHRPRSSPSASPGTTIPRSRTSRRGWAGLGSLRRRARPRCAAGFGIFYDEILPKYYFFSGSLNPPFTTRTSITNPPFPNVRGELQPGRAHPRAAADRRTSTCRRRT